MSDDRTLEARERIEKQMKAHLDDMLGDPDSLVKVAVASKGNRSDQFKRYRSSFLSMSDMDIPDDFREIFKWCRYYFKVDSLIGPAVRLMATFPVTDYVIQDTKKAEDSDQLSVGQDSRTLDFYKRMLKDLKLTNMMQEIGYDYFLYGNCILFGETEVVDVKRRDELGDIQTEPQVSWRHIERLDLTRVRIMRDTKTRDVNYFYDIPMYMKKILRDKKPADQYKKIPAIYKKAFETDSLVKLNKKNVFHFKMPTESGDDTLWATPPVLSVLKLVMYKNVLRQAQEAIANEHIVPRRVYFFPQNGNSDPGASHASFKKIAGDFSNQLTRQLNDPNHQIVSPVPVQEIQQGGQGRNLLLVPEIEQLQKEILAGMQIPHEFMFGGMSYSGSTVSLRVLENQFITYRQLLEEFINNFLVKRLAEIRGEWETYDDDDKLITVELSDLKMQDDLQQKQLLFQMNQSGKIPDEVFYEKGFGMDAEQIRKQLYNEKEAAIKDQVRLALFQKEFETELIKKGVDPAIVQSAQGAGQGTEGAPPDGSMPQGNPNEPVADDSQGGSQGAQTQALMEAAQQLAQMSPEEAEMAMSQMNPGDATAVRPYYEQMKTQEPAVDMRPAPEKLPPRREGGI